MTIPSTPTLAALWASSDEPPPKVFEWSEAVILILSSANHEPVEVVRERLSRGPRPDRDWTFAEISAAAFVRAETMRAEMMRNDQPVSQLRSISPLAAAVYARAETLRIEPLSLNPNQSQ